MTPVNIMAQRFPIPALMLVFVLLVAVRNARTQNARPVIDITWPHSGESLAEGTGIKIKTDSFDQDGQVRQVEFYIDNQLVGKATERPFNIVWRVTAPIPHGILTLKAVAMDNLGATGESRPIALTYSSTAPNQPVVQIIGPAHDSIVPFGSSIAFSAEVLASLGDSGPVEFIIGTNSVGTLSQSSGLQATNPPLSIALSNLVEGEHQFTVRYRGAGGVYCTCNAITNSVRITKLGITNAKLAIDGRLQAQIVTSFPQKETGIEASDDLENWSRITTVVPTDSYFDFVVTPISGKNKKWYRAVITAP
jgi:hypothetical protein